MEPVHRRTSAVALALRWPAETRPRPPRRRGKRSQGEADVPSFAPSRRRKCWPRADRNRFVILRLGPVEEETAYDTARVAACLNRHQKPALRETGLPAFDSTLRLRGW